MDVFTVLGVNDESVGCDIFLIPGNVFGTSLKIIRLRGAWKAVA